MLDEGVDSVTEVTERMTRLPDYAWQRRAAMKTLLVGIAFAMGMVFATQAFALPNCPDGRWQNGHFICASCDE